MVLGLLLGGFLLALYGWTLDPKRTRWPFIVPGVVLFGAGLWLVTR